MLDFVDREVVDALTYCMRERGTIFRLGEKVVSVRADNGSSIVAELESGKQVQGETLLYAVGRQANGDQLNLEAAGLAPDARGRIPVDPHFRTTVPHIYAAGDVIGFPALASSSMEQGRLAACHMFGSACGHDPELLPYGIYTIPEISMVGKTEQELTASKTPYEVGVARYVELAKGQMLGAEVGMLKILFDPRSLRVLGIHIFGDHATELIHIGQAVLAHGGTMTYFRDTAFNYPTLAEAYKVAGLNGLNKVEATA
jgi:NAD(P) transhydrogenase